MNRAIATSISRLDVPIRVAVILASVLVIFFQDILVTGSDALGSDYYNYVLIVPLLMAYLVYRKRKVLSAVVHQGVDEGKTYASLIAGASGLVVALMVYLDGSYSSFPVDYHLIALQIFLASSILMLFNWQTLKILLFPILLISTALQSAVQFGLSIWLYLSWTSTYGAYLVLKELGLRATYTLTGNVPSISLAGSNGVPYTFVTGVASSGVYSLIGFTLFAVFVAYIAKGSVLRRSILFAFGYPLLIAVNIVRVVILVGAAYLWGTLAFDVFHFSSGIVLVFTVTLLLLLVGDRFMKLEFFKLPSRPVSCASCPEQIGLGRSFCAGCGRFLNSTRNTIRRSQVMAILAIILVGVIFVSSLAPAVAVASTPTNVDPAAALSPPEALHLLPQVNGWNLSYIYRDTYVQDVLAQDAALIYSYTPSSIAQPQTNARIFVAVQISSGLHIPEASIVTHPQLTGQSGANVLQDYDVPILFNPPLTGRFLAYRPAQSNATEVIFYWNTRAVFNFSTYSDFRNVQFSLIAYPQALASSGLVHNSSDLQGVEQLLMPIARSIAIYWVPQGVSSVVQAGVSRWSVPISIAAVLPAAAVVTRSTLEKKRAGEKSKVVYEQLSENDRELLRTVRDCQRNKKRATTEDVVKSYKDLTKKEIGTMDVLAALTYARRAGLVRQKIVDIDGEPLLVWETLPFSLK